MNLGNKDNWEYMNQRKIEKYRGQKGIGENRNIWYSMENEEVR